MKISFRKIPLRERAVLAIMVGVAVTWLASHLVWHQPPPPRTSTLVTDFAPAVISTGHVQNLPPGDNLALGSGGIVGATATFTNEIVANELTNAGGQFSFGAEYAGTITGGPITGTVTDLSLAGGQAASIWRVSTSDSSGAILEGITLSNDGRAIVWQNLGPGTVTLKNESSGETAPAQRILTVNAVDSAIPPQSGFGFHYDATQQRWIEDWVGSSLAAAGVSSVACGANMSCSPSPVTSTGTVSVLEHPTFTGLVSTAGGVLNELGSIIEQAGDTWLDVATGSDIALGSGLTADWDPYDGGSAAMFLVATPFPAVAPGEISTSDSVIDGIVNDGRGAAPLAGSLRTICQSAINHGPIAVLAAETSTSSSPNQIYINADGNAMGTAMGLAHRQCALFVYDPTVSKWQPVAAGDGSTRRWSISGYWNDTALGATVSSYDAGGTPGTHLCGLTRLRLASAGATTFNSMVACNPGDIKEFMVFSGGITIKQNSGTGTAPFFLPGSADKTLVANCTYWFQYDGPNAGWYLVMSSGGSC